MCHTIFCCKSPQQKYVSYRASCPSFPRGAETIRVPHCQCDIQGSVATQGTDKAELTKLCSAYFYFYFHNTFLSFFFPFRLVNTWFSSRELPLWQCMKAWQDVYESALSTIPMPCQWVGLLSKHSQSRYHLQKLESSTKQWKN